MGKMKDLTGQRFGKLLVIECAGKLDGRRYWWKCKCDCGNEKIIRGASLTSGNSTSCGCNTKIQLQQYLQKKTENSKIPIGTRFGKLVVIKDIGFKEISLNHKRRCYECQCDCGNTCIVDNNTLKSLRKLSCGKCSGSQGELKIQALLDKANIIYNYDCQLPELTQNCGRKLRFDFIIYNKDNQISRIIEFDGKQHEGMIYNTWTKTNEEIKDLLERDVIKNKFCIEHNIPLVRIPYNKLQSLTLDDLLGDNFLIKGDNK